MTATKVSANEWRSVLAHRVGDDAVLLEVSKRFAANGIGPSTVRKVLRDGGRGLAAAATSDDADWPATFGGSLAVALLAAEVAAHSAYLVSRAAAVRSLAVERLLDDFSAIAVAEQLGLSRQKVYELARDTPQRRAAIAAMHHAQAAVEQ